jgi:hypothetical protein
MSIVWAGLVFRIFAGLMVAVGESALIETYFTFHGKSLQMIPCFIHQNKCIVIHLCSLVLPVGHNFCLM